jgi:large subunit ribosomal protein L13
MYTPNADVGDFVVVINAEKIAVTGTKLSDKMYYRHSGYPGGLTKMTLEQMLARHPERVLQAAVRGMLPHNSLGADMLGKLKVYAGAKHPHDAQQPRALADAFRGQPTGARYATVNEG